MDGISDDIAKLYEQICEKAPLLGCDTQQNDGQYLLNPLTPELNPSAQRCLPTFLNGDYF
jgi:hypothetical protein